MLLGGFLQIAHSLINAVWVGRGLGPQSIAAVTVSFPPFFLLMSVAGGLTMAASVMASQAYGARDDAKVRTVIDTSCALTIVISLLCTVAGREGAEPLLRLMGTTSDVLPIAVPYLRLLVLTIPLMFGLFLLASLLRGVGDSRTPLFFQAGSLLLTVILDPILIFGWLGAPRLELNGTAVANFISQVLGLIALLWYLWRKGHFALPGRGCLTPSPTVAWEMIRIGVPSMLQQGLVSVGMVVLIGLVNGFGTVTTAAFGAAMRIDQLAFMPAMNVGAAVSSLAGQNIGARRFDRVRQIFLAGAALSLGMTAIATGVAVFFPEFILRGFLKDPEPIALGVEYLRIVGPGYLLFALMFVSNGIINGAGDTLATTFFSLIGLWLIRLPLATWLSRSWHSPTGIWWAMVISFGIAMVMSVLYYGNGRWMRRLPEA